MPDSDGRIRGISIPSVPWHEDENAREQQREYCEAPAWWIEHHNKGVQDADQMLWDKQTQNGSH